jgi:hypothetical protein
MGFKMMGGKAPKEKTGSGIPLNMKSPLKSKTDPKEKDESKETKEDNVLKRYPGAVKREGTTNEYDYKGTTLIPGIKKKKQISDKEKIAKSINNKK